MMMMNAKCMSMMASLVLLTSCGGSEESFSVKPVKPDFIMASPPTGMTLLSGASPSSNPNPKVKVLGMEGSVVQIFTNPDCDGEPLTTSATETFILPALKAGKYEFYAKLISGPSVSACSEKLLDYWSLIKLPMSFDYGKVGLDADVEKSEAADLDGDGFVDYVYTKKNSKNSGIAFGTGESHFADMKVLPLPHSATAIKITDIDGDKFKDVLIGDDQRNLYLFRNDGGRIFTFSLLISMGSNGSGSIDHVEYEDLNGDRLGDYLLHTSHGKFYVKFADPDGGYFDTIPLMAGSSFTDFTIIDMNFDRQLDIVNREGNSFQVYSNAAGKFSLSGAIVTSMPKGSAVLGDLNSDGYPDIISQRNNELKVKLSNSHGGYGLEKVMNTLYSYQSSSLMVIDINQDQMNDLIFFDKASESLVVQRGNDDGTFQAPIMYPNFKPSPFITLDVNHDGKLDIFGLSVLIQK